MENQTLTHIEKTAKEIEHYTEGANLALTEMRLQFETLAEMQKEERLESQRMHKEEKEKMRKHYGRIIAGLIVALCLIFCGIIGGVIYVLSTFEYAEITYQDLDSGDNGLSQIYDGIHINAD